MRLFKVRTWTDLTIQSRTIFGQMKKESRYFTWNEKYIYAKDKDEAKMKYGDYFYNPAEDGYDELKLMIREMDYCTKSSNMKFTLKFNEKVVHTNEHIVVYEEPVIANIDVVKRLSTADDFKNWYFNRNAENQCINSDNFDEIFK